MGRAKRRFVSSLAIAAALVLVPATAVAEAPPLTGTINAVDYAWENPATGQGKVVIAPGGTVDFAYPSGSSAHNVVFTGAAPTSCTQTSGSNSGAVPPLPATPTGPSWAGNCKFEAEGTYAFVCGFHATMKGSVVVSATVPAEPPGGGGGGSGGSGGSGGGGGGAGTGAAAAASKATVPRDQRGAAVRGSVVIGADGSKLTVDLFARRAALGGSGTKPVRVGHLAKVVGDGRVGFRAVLSAAAKRAVEESGKLAVTVRFKVKPAAGAVFTATRTTTVRPAS